MCLNPGWVKLGGVVLLSKLYLNQKYHNKNTNMKENILCSAFLSTSLSKGRWVLLVKIQLAEFKVGVSKELGKQVSIRRFHFFSTKQIPL